MPVDVGALSAGFIPRWFQCESAKSNLAMLEACFLALQLDVISTVAISSISAY